MLFVCFKVKPFANQEMVEPDVLHLCGSHNFTLYLFLTYLYNYYTQLFIYTLDYIVFYTGIYLHMVLKGKYIGNFSEF